MRATADSAHAIRDNIWGVGLNAQEWAEVSQGLGESCQIFPMPEDALDFRGQPGGDCERAPHLPYAPVVTLISSRAWAAMDAEERAAMARWNLSPKVLVLDRRGASDQADAALSEGFMAVLRRPLATDRLHEVVRRAKEMRLLREDILGMTREIALERELLLRKTEQLMFLNRVLSRTTESLDAAAILAGVRDDLETILPVADLHAVFFPRRDEQGWPDADLFIGECLPAPAHDAWVSYLMDQVSALCGKTPSGYREYVIPRSAAADRGEPVSVTELVGVSEDNPVRLRKPSDATEIDLEGPASDKTLFLALGEANRRWGGLAIRCRTRPRLGKDQLQVLRSATQHLALAFKNVFLYQEAKSRADHDALTRLPNRGALEARLMDEFKRRQRYDVDLSLLMVDIDHFKQINDSMGHLAGDFVLREVASTLRACLRSTDFPARYGGEEFAIVLPHTAEEHAWIIADRIRAAVAKRLFEWEGHSFKVTVSIGVAGMKPGALAAKAELVRLADSALYQAKAAGRNAVCLPEGRGLVTRTSAKTSGKRGGEGAAKEAARESPKESLKESVETRRSA